MSSWNQYLFFWIGIGCYLLFGATASSIQSNYKSGAGRLKAKAQLTPTATTTTLFSKKNGFLSMEEGTIPAWVSPDGLMRVPSVQPASVMDDFGGGGSKDAEHMRINRNFGAVVPGIHPPLNPIKVSSEGKEDPVIRFAEFVPSLRHQMAARGRRDKFSSAHKVTFQPDCADCYAEFLSPSLTYSDGSDIFKYDFFDPSHSFPPEFNDSNIKAPSNCYFETDWLGHLICHDRSITKVPANLPKVPLSIFELNTTGVQVLQRGDFDQLDVVVMKLEANLIETIEKGSFNTVTSIQSLYIKYNLIQTLDWQLFDGLTSLVVLSLRGNQIDLSKSFLDAPPAKTSFLPQLTHLDLSENPLGALHQYVFSELEDSPIEELNLKSCKLNYIDPGKFFQINPYQFALRLTVLFSLIC